MTIKRAVLLMTAASLGLALSVTWIVKQAGNWYVREVVYGDERAGTVSGPMDYKAEPEIRSLEYYRQQAEHYERLYRSTLEACEEKHE